MAVHTPIPYGHMRRSRARAYSCGAQPRETAVRHAGCGDLFRGCGGGRYGRGHTSWRYCNVEPAPAMRPARTARPLVGDRLNPIFEGTGSWVRRRGADTQRFNDDNCVHEPAQCRPGRRGSGLRTPAVRDHPAPTGILLRHRTECGPAASSLLVVFFLFIPIFS